MPTLKTLSDWQNDVFVDSEAGDDSNDGQGPSRPKATLIAAEAEALNLGNGVRIGLRYGRDWQGTIDLSSISGVVVRAYGNKDDGLPVMDGREQITATWNDSTDRGGDGFSNTYSLDLTTSAAGYPFLTEDDLPPDWRGSVSDVDATSGTFTITDGSGTVLSSQQSAGTYTFYIHPRGSTDPNADDKDYRFTKLKAPDFGPDSDFKHIRFKSFVSRNGVTTNMGKATIIGCLFDRTSAIHSALPSSGAFDHCVDWHDWDDPREDYIGLEFFTTDGTGLEGSWTRCIGVGLDGATQDHLMIGGHTGTGEPLYEKMEAVDCSVQNMRIDLTDITKKAITTRLHLLESQLRQAGVDVCNITDPWLEGARFVGIAIGSLPAPVVIDGLRCYGDYREALVNGFDSLVFKRSVVVRDDNDFRSQVVVETGGELEMAGVVFGEFNKWFKHHVEVKASPNSDNNIFGGGFNYIVDGTTYTDLSNLQTTENIELNSQDADPQLLDPANGDFRIGNTSLPNDVGLERDPTCQNYTPIPASLEEAEAWILENT